MSAEVSSRPRSADLVLEKGGDEIGTKDTSDTTCRPLSEQPVTLAADSAAERRLVRKLDLIIFPIFFILYMMSFLDRINISNAKIQGMNEELNLTGHRFNVALFVSSHH